MMTFLKALLVGLKLEDEHWPTDEGSIDFLTPVQEYARSLLALGAFLSESQKIQLNALKWLLGYELSERFKATNEAKIKEAAEAETDEEEAKDPTYDPAEEAAEREEVVDAPEGAEDKAGLEQNAEAKETAEQKGGDPGNTDNDCDDCLPPRPLPLPDPNDMQERRPQRNASQPDVLTYDERGKQENKKAAQEEEEEEEAEKATSSTSGDDVHIEDVEQKPFEDREKFWTEAICGRVFSQQHYLSKLLPDAADTDATVPAEYTSMQGKVLMELIYLVENMYFQKMHQFKSLSRNEEEDYEATWDTFATGVALGFYNLPSLCKGNSKIVSILASAKASDKDKLP